jgi:hypothetical protein
LEVLADVGTAAAAVANLILVAFALKNLQALRDQIEVGHDAATAARQSAAAAADAVREAARMRVDEQAPRVVVVMEESAWPPMLDRQRSGMPGGGEPTLFDTAGQAEVPTGELYFDLNRKNLLYFTTRGLLINEGNGAARIQPSPAVRLVSGTSGLHKSGSEQISIPPVLGAGLYPEYLLRPGEVALFEWKDGHTLGDWADAYENDYPPNPLGACFLEMVVTDWLSSGVVDHHHVLLQTTPIEPVPGRQGTWKLRDAPVPGSTIGVVAFPPNRTYRAHHEEGAAWPPPPWQEVFAERAALQESE